MLKRPLLTALLIALCCSALAYYTPGQTIGYTSCDITPPSEVVGTRLAMLNAINYELQRYPTQFTITATRDFPMDALPRQLVEVEYSFLQGALVPTVKSENGLKKVTYSVTYNVSGRAAAYYKLGRGLEPGDTQGQMVVEKVDSILNDLITPGMTETEKVDAIHDYIVRTCAYGDQKQDFRNAYGALVNKQANCQGYAEALSLLLTSCDIENRIVWAKSRVSETGTHGFIKAFVDGGWYNIDCTVDDPTPDDPGRVRHDYLMVDDDVSAQRYSWERSRYPKSGIFFNNWHYRNGLVASDKKTFQSMVKAAIKAREPNVSIWVEDYNVDSMYSTSWVKKRPDIGYTKTSITAAAKGVRPIKTAVYIDFEY